MPHFFIGEIRRILGIFLDWLKISNLGGSTHIYKQSWVPELVKYINAYCLESATFVLEICKPQLHVANYINVDTLAKLQELVTVDSDVPTQTDLELNVGQSRWQILRLHSKPSILISSRSSCFNSERMPNLSSTRIEYQLCPYVYNFYKFKDKIFIKF